MNPYSPYSTPPGHSGGYPYSASPSPAGSPSGGQHGYYARPTTARPTPARPSSRQQHTRSTSTSAGDAWGYSPRGAFSPRYNSSGYYATAANASGFAAHDEEDDDFESSPPRYETPPPKPQPTKDHRRPSTSMPKNRPTTARPTTARPTTARPGSSSSKKAAPPPSKPAKATDADARKHRIPAGYSLKNWDPSEEPIMLLGSVFDANSLGKWIYDWTVYHHGPATPMADMSGELWLLLIQLAGKVKRAEECMDRIRTKENREMVDDFIESGDRLTDKLKKLLKACETPMLKAGKKTKESAQLGKNAGTEFVDSLFGRDRQLDATEKFMSSIRLWNLRFDANCEDILRRPGQ